MKKQIFTPKIVLCGACVLIELLSLSSIGLAQEPWTEKAPMQTPRIRLSTSAVNGKIYAIGGWNVNKVLATVEEYDPTTDTWTTKEPMPTARVQLTTSTVNGKIYAIGGAISPGEAGLSTVEEYDPVTNTWTTKKPMPTARTILSSSVVNGKIYVIGGWLGPSGSWVATVEEYDPVTDTWTKKTDMPTARWGLSTCAVDDKIFAIGGANTSGAGFQGGLHTVEVYDPLTDTWESKADMPTRRVYFAASVVNGIIYAIGDNISILEAYNPVTDDWIKQTDMPTTRWGLSASAVNGKIYVIGGSTNSNWPDPPTAIVEEYDPSKDLMGLVKNVYLNKYFVVAGSDSVCIFTKMNNPVGVTLFAEIEAPDQTPVDSLQLFDDGNHNDGKAGDSLYANIWPVSSGEEQHYYIDLHVTKVGTDTVIHHMNNMASFTTIGPVVFENYIFSSSDTVPDPGDRIRIKLTLMNDGSVAAATNIAAKLISLDPLVDIVTGSQNYDDIDAGSTIQCNMSYVFDIAKDHPVNTEIPFALEILSEDYTFWRDTFSIMVEEPVNNTDNITEPITRIYPNPASDQLNLEFTSIPEVNTIVELMDISGKIIYSGMADVNSTNHTIDLHSFKEGLYLIRISNEKYTVTKKVIKY